MTILVLRDVCTPIDPSLGQHIVVGIADHACSRCGAPIAISFPGGEADIEELVLLCMREGLVLPLHDFSFAVQQLVEDRIRFIKDDRGFEDSARRMFVSVEENPVRSTKAPLIHPRAMGGVGQSSSANSGSIDVPVPEGFRTVSWIRQYEAELIQSTYENGRGFLLSADDGSPMFETQFFSAESAEARKYRAQVLGIRHRRNGSRNLGWIRREEASAVLRAYEQQKTIDFHHTTYGRGGRVEFFGADSQEAQTYRSQTRLLRRVF